MFSVVELPSTKFSLLKEEGESDAPAEDNESLIRESSLTYFRSTEVLLKDLKRELRGNKASAAIMERYAGRIDRMPILHVDDDSARLWLQPIGDIASDRSFQATGGSSSWGRHGRMGGGGYSNYSSGYGYFGNLGDRYAGARASAADRSAIKAQAMAESKNTRVEGAKLIADATAKIRRQMTQKYQVEF